MNEKTQLVADIVMGLIAFLFNLAVLILVAFVVIKALRWIGVIQ